MRMGPALALGRHASKDCNGCQSGATPCRIASMRWALLERVSPIKFFRKEYYLNLFRLWVIFVHFSELVGLSDLDMAGNLDNRKRTSCVLIFLWVESHQLAVREVVACNFAFMRWHNLVAQITLPWQPKLIGILC